MMFAMSLVTKLLILPMRPLLFELAPPSLDFSASSDLVGGGASTTVTEDDETVC